MGNPNLPTTWEEDGYTATRITMRTAPGCHEGCGIICYVKDGKLVKVEGDKEHPFNQGRLCPRCIALPDVVNHPDRLLYPMKRDPSQRGNPDAWERITWDEAYDLIVSEFKRISDTYGSWTLQTFCGTGREALWQPQRLAFAAGTPHVESYASGLACWMPRLVTYIFTTGDYMMPDLSECHEDRYDNPEWRLPEVIISWGNNSVNSSSDCFFGDWLVECMRRGSKLITIDPRLTWLAARSEIWIQPRPAVDSAISIAMLKTIIEEDLYDHQFVEEWCYGFEELAERCASYDFDFLCERAWVDGEKVRAAARMYAAGNHSAIQLGLAVDMQRHGVAAAMAIIDMMAICGNLEQPGGQVFTHGAYDVVGFGWGWDDLTQEQQEKLIGYKEYPMIRMGMRLDQPDLAVTQALTEEPYGFKGALMMGTNPVNCMSNANLDNVLAALKKLEFIAVADPFMTPTCQLLADVILPVAMCPERTTLQGAYTYLLANRPVAGLEIQGEPKGDSEIAFELGKKLNPDMFPWDNVEDMLTAMLVHSGLTFDEVVSNHWMYEGLEYERYKKGLCRQDGKPGFATASGRVELYSTMAESVGHDPLPYFEEPYEGPYSSPELYEENPNIVITGSRMIQFFHSEHRQIAKLREIQPDPMIEVNDKWAIDNGIREGDWVWIENEFGRIRQKAKPTPILKYGIANMNSGWWFPEMDPHDDPMYGAYDVNPNVLSSIGHQGPTGFGADVKALLCKIYKCEEGEF